MEVSVIHSNAAATEPEAKGMCWQSRAPPGRQGEALLGMWAFLQLAEALEQGTIAHSISLH